MKAALRIAAVCCLLAGIACNDSQSSPPRVARDAQHDHPRPDDLVLVSAGWFTSGCVGVLDLPGARYPADERIGACVAEAPPRRLWISSFEIDRLETTRAAYRECVKAGACRDVLQLDLEARRAPDESRLPARVPFQEAEAFCQWRGLRLPTAAEWEKAARGTDGRLFPWGDEPPTCLRASFSEDRRNGILFGDECGELEVVGQHPQGRSPYGAHDMFGNAAEWTSDPYRVLDAEPEADYKPRYTREDHGAYAIVRFDWSSARYVWLDPSLIDPRGPEQSQIRDADRGKHAVKGGAGLVGLDEAGGFGDDGTPIAGIRCVRSQPGDTPPQVPKVAGGEFMHPYREDAP